MADIVTHKANAARFDYEYLGKTVQQIATLYGFSPSLVQAQVDVAGWERKLEPSALPDTKNMQDFADQLEKITRSKLSIISLFRQIDNQAMYAELETAILQKALEATATLTPEDDRVATKLAHLTKTLVAIQERNPIQLADQFKELASGQGAGVVVNIANQIQ